LQFDKERMSKSSGEFLRLQSLIDRGYDPLAYRYFSLNALYRAKLTFSWESLDSAARALDRLRRVVYECGEPGRVDEEFMEQFHEQINDDLNMPRALAVTWDLARSDLEDAAKKATILQFDRVLGLRLGEWEPGEADVPDEIMLLVEKRKRARAEERWSEADAYRDEIQAAGFEVEDTPEGPRVKKNK
jgi:cysteinyl-tRNA synthetase